MMQKRMLLAGCLFLTIVSSVYAADSINIDDDSFAVIYESPMNSDKGLILFIRNSKCIGSYRITNSNSDLIIAQGDINTRGPEKTIYLGQAKLRVDCGPLQSLTVTRQ